MKRTGISAGKSCVPGTTWKDDCNNCFCSETGRAVCTYLICSPTQPQYFRNNRYTEAETKNVNFKCEPNKSIKVECNTCWCNENGKIDHCTRASCASDKSPAPRIFWKPTHISWIHSVLNSWIKLEANVHFYLSLQERLANLKIFAILMLASF